MDKENVSDETQVYEVGYHILPSVPEEKLSEEVAKIQDVITKSGGSIISEEFPKQKALAYDINKRVETKYVSVNRAYFGWIKFEVSPSTISKIEGALKINDNILRFLIIKTIRENTVALFKTVVANKEAGKDEAAPKEKVETDEAEIDKSIDELLVSEN